MDSFFRAAGWIVLVIVGVLLIGYILENVVQPFLYSIGHLLAFLIKWAFIIGIPILVAIGVYDWITRPRDSNK